MRSKYAYRIKTTRIREPDFPYNGQQITCTTELVEFCHSLRELDIEKFVALYLDSQNYIMGIQIFRGTVDQAVVYPREVIRHALLCNASAIILAHNHPSGKVQPSDSDIRVTKVVKEVADMMNLAVHDHIVIGNDNGRFFSFREEGMMP